jgi:putative heme-binding domain-containing protein
MQRHIVLASFVCTAFILRQGPILQADDGATPVDRIHLLEGFQAELLYSVPSEEEGSWVNLTVDEQGRLITSDQYGKLYRITVPPAGELGEIHIETIDLDIGMAHGLLCAFDSLYVVVNGNDRLKSGLYRVRDTDADDRYDSVELLRAIAGAGEHGPHAVILSPDGNSLYICGGNHTKIPEPELSVVPRVWDEDHVLHRMWDAGGHAVDIMAPGGWVCQCDPNGENFELISTGYRNEFDIAFNPAGELFTYDADMEWDIGTPWYRPTRVNHVTSGSEFGWRSGTGKWPEDYPDSLGAVVNIGPGSPTGIVFGTGALFPEKYQRALFLCDWSYGIIYAVHLTPEGSSYTGTFERFADAQPFPVTDLIVNPHDGALYVTIGGRRTQSGLYRITYHGSEPTTPVVNGPDAGSEARAVRHMLERLHGRNEASAVETAWPYLSSDDRSIRFGARIAIEHQPVELWRERVLSEENPTALMHGAIALARHGGAADLAALIDALARLEWDSLSNAQKIDLLRVYGLAFVRLGEGSEELRQRVADRISPHYPATNQRLNQELVIMCVYLDVPQTAERTLDLLDAAITQEEQLHYAFCLKDLDTGWNDDLRRRYFEWFLTAGGHRGGHSYRGFVENIREEAAEGLTPSERTAFADVLELPIEEVDPAISIEPREVVQRWTVDDLVASAESAEHGRNFEQGRRMFAIANCFKCHRVGGEGGSTGPDLTGAGGRFNVRNLLESIIEPNKVISDQYLKTVFALTDGRVVEGRIVNLVNDEYRVMTNMLDPDAQETIKRDDVEESRVSDSSMMPANLVDTLTQEEILDLMAYLRSGGNPDAEYFQPAPSQ